MTESKMIKIIVFSTLIILSGCGTQMHVVMQQCDRGVEFNSYASCIKNTYAREGTNPNHIAVRAFYSNLDAISEAYRDKKITDAQAKSFAYDAYQKTVQASNDKAEAAYNSAFSNYMLQQQQNQINKPRQTSCTTMGQFVNCTTY